MKRFRTSILLFLAGLWLSMPVTSAATITVTGQGGSERGALKQALRQAVEQQVGVLVDSRTYVQNYKLIYDRIYTATDGYIKSYSILESSAVNGIYKVKVQVDVQEQKINAALGTLAQKQAIIKANMQDPRIGVLAVDKQGRQYPSVENEIISGLTSQGFTRVVDLAQVSDALRRRLLAADASGDKALWQALKVQSPVDYFVTAQVDMSVGSLADYVNQPGFANLKRAAAVIAVRMLNANTGEVIYAGNFSGKSERRGPNAEQEAIQNACRNIARPVGEAALNKAANPRQHITLLVTGGKLGNISELTSYLEGLPGVHNVFVRGSAWNNITVDVDFNGTAHDLAAVLEGQGMPVSEMGSEYVKI